MDAWKEEKLTRLQGLLAQGDTAAIAGLLADMHQADIAQIMEPLPQSDKIAVLGALPAAMAAEVIVEVPDHSREQLLEELHPERLAEMLDDLPSDEATDIIADLPDPQAKAVLERIDAQDRHEVHTLLQYDEDTAGGIMQLELVKARPEQTVNQVIEKIRQKRDEVENLANVFVVDDHDHLLGVLPLTNLILADPLAMAGDIMQPAELVIRADEDQERVAHKVKRYDLMSTPVVDSRGRLLGRITGDDVMEVLEDEAGEDMMRMVGSTEEDMVYSDRILKITRMRLPWLLSNLIGGMVSAWLLWMFRVQLADAIFLVSFMPLIMGMSGNVGVQSSTIMVRGFAMGRVSFGNLGRILFKELRVALIMGVAIGTCVGLVAHLWHNRPVLGLVVFISIVVAVSTAALLGTLAPAAFKKLNVDPAVSSGPLVTTLNDITAIIIYFATATLFYHGLVS